MHDTRRPASIFREFLESEAAGGIILMAAAALALIVANSPLSGAYFSALHAYLGPLSVSHWINDGLMAVFFLLVGLLSAAPDDTMDRVLLVMDMVNIGCGYLSFLLLGWLTLTKAERRGFWKVLLSTPPYWAMMSYAGWRALWQLWRRPHLWEKTPHEEAAAFPARANNWTGMTGLRR